MSTPLCILLVDDSPFFLNLERQFLRNTPATLIEAKSAGQALELARRYLPNLVIMDIDMPGGDGLSCCRQFRNECDLKGIPIVLVGDRTCPEQHAEALAAGSVGFLTKPLDRNKFLEVGHRLLVSIDRREPRRNCQIPVSFAWQGIERYGQCIDISSGGMFLKIEPQAVKGDLLFLRLRLPDPGLTLINLTGRIAWFNLPDTVIKPGYPSGYGLEFVDITEATGVALRRCFGA